MVASRYSTSDWVPKHDGEFKPVGVFGSGFGRVSHDAEVFAGDDESVAVERDPADRGVLDDGLVGPTNSRRLPIRPHAVDH
jgi:hypothetical protein